MSDIQREITDEQGKAIGEDITAVPAPEITPFDALVIRVDLELGGERIRMTEPILEFGPQHDHEFRLRAYRSRMAHVADELLAAMERAGWGEK